MPRMPSAYKAVSEAKMALSLSIIQPCRMSMLLFQLVRIEFSILLVDIFQLDQAASVSASG